MAFGNGAESAAERRAADDGESGQAGSDDVTITIRGSMAARMLGRGDAEDRILTELARLTQRLDGMEAAAARQAADHDALKQAVQGMQDRVAHLNDQVAMQVTELRTGLASLRSAFDSHALSAVHLPGQVERVQGQIGLLQSQVNPLASELAQLQMRLVEMDARLPPSPTRSRHGVAGVQTDGISDPRTGWGGILDRFSEKWRQPDKPSGNGEASANGSWLKQRLNGLWLW